MRCEDIEGKLAAFVLDELGRDESEDVSKHLASCERCRSEADRYRRTLSALGRWRVPAHPGPPNFSILPALPVAAQNPAKRKRRYWMYGRNALGAAVAAVLVIGLFFTIHIEYKNGMLSINIGTAASRYEHSDAAAITAIVDSVRKEDMQIISKMISASEARQAEMYRTSLASYSRRVDERQRSYIAYIMDHMYRLQQQDRVAYYQSRAALDGVIKLASSAR